MFPGEPKTPDPTLFREVLHMPKSVSSSNIRLRAVVDLDLRRRPDVTCEEWYHWSAGEIFAPPPHMLVDKALERGIAVLVDDLANDVSGSPLIPEDVEEAL